MADFRTRTPAVDPQAFANVLQRKAQMEQEQLNIERREKQERFKRFTDAVIAGQTIASNMLTVAEKRNQLSQEQNRQAALKNYNELSNKPIPTPELPTDLNEMTPEGLARRKADMVTSRAKQLESLLLEAAGPEKAAEYKLKQLNPNKGFAPQQSSVELSNGKIIPAAFINGKFYYPNTSTEIPPDEIVGKGYGLVPITDSEGNVKMVSRSTAKALGKVGTASGEVPESKKETVSSVFELPKEKATAARERIESIKNDKDYTDEISKINQAARLEIATRAKNFTIDEKLGASLARLFGDAGNISIIEQSTGRENRQIFEQGKQAYQRYIKDGTLTEENRKSIQAAMAVMKDAALINLDSIVNRHVDSMSVDYPELKKEAIYRNMVSKTYDGEIKKAKAKYVKDEGSDDEVDNFFKEILKGN